MKSLFSFITLLLVSVCFAQNKQDDSTVYRDARIYDARMAKFNLPDSVFVCGTDTTRKFHYNKNCRGLNNCKQPITKLEYIYAIDHRELCGWERDK